MSPELSDAINAIFEVCGGVTVWLNVRKLYADKRVSGVYWPAFAFYAAWGSWNMLYYPAIGQWLSFYAGLLIVTGNATWVALALRYRATIVSALALLTLSGCSDRPMTIGIVGSGAAFERTVDATYDACDVWGVPCDVSPYDHRLHYDVVLTLTAGTTAVPGESVYGGIYSSFRRPAACEQTIAVSAASTAGVIAHELGHAWGKLEHHDLPENLMYAFSPANFTLDDWQIDRVQRKVDARMWRCPRNEH